jgi:hypothetical protein
MNTRPERACVIMRGISGSGKSTRATQICTMTRSAVVCSADDFFVGHDGVYRFDRRRVRDAHAACMKRFLAALNASATLVVVDNTNTRYWEYKEYEAAACAHGYVVRFEEARCSSEAQARTFNARNAHGVPLEAALAMWRRWKPDRRAVCWDNAGDTLETAAPTRVETGGSGHEGARIRRRSVELKGAAGGAAGVVRGGGRGGRTESLPPGRRFGQLVDTESEPTHGCNFAMSDGHECGHKCDGENPWAGRCGYHVGSEDRMRTASHDTDARDWTATASTAAGSVTRTQRA